MKRTIIKCLLVCLLVTMALVPVYAAIGQGNEISPMALYYRYADAGISISSSGSATVDGTIVGITGTTTKTTVHLYLQRYEDGEWVDVADWVKSNESVSTTVSKTKSVTSGYKYRAKASCYAYSGSDYERVIKYSSEVTY